MKTKNWNYQPKTKDFPEWVIIPIAIGGFLTLYFLGVFADWLLNLQIILK